MALLTLKNVTMAYENTVAVENVSAEIFPGDYVAVVGENGSGKSTLIKGMLGLMRPRSGLITMGDGLRLNEIGYLPQQTAAQKDFPASVGEVALSGCLNRRGLRPFYSAREREICARQLRLLGIEKLRGKSYRDLSGGQQQRVLLARALCATRKLLLLDEPATGLDPMAAAELYALICRLNREEGISVIMVSHDIASALRDANKILCMHRTLAFFGPTEEFEKSRYGMLLMGGGAHA